MRAAALRPPRPRLPPASGEGPGHGARSSGRAKRALRRVRDVRPRRGGRPAVRGEPARPGHGEAGRSEAPQARGAARRAPVVRRRPVRQPRPAAPARRRRPPRVLCAVPGDGAAPGGARRRPRGRDPGPPGRRGERRALRPGVRSRARLCLSPDTPAPRGALSLSPGPRPFDRAALRVLAGGRRRSPRRPRRSRGRGCEAGWRGVEARR